MLMDRKCVCSLLVGMLVITTSSATSLNSVLTSLDVVRLFETLKNGLSDAKTAYYAVAGMKSYTPLALGTVDIVSVIEKSACDAIKSCDTNSVSDLAAAAMALKEISSSCEYTFPPEATELAKSKLHDESDVKSMYEAMSFLNYVGENVDNDAVMGYLMAAVKNDNSVLTSSRAILTALKVDPSKLSDLVNLIDIEDVAAQADEVDSKYLHFENDLETTSSFVTAVFSLSETTGSKLPVSGEQITMFLNYILRSRTVATSPKDVFLILSALGKAASSKVIAVAKAELVSSRSLSEAKPNVAIAVLDVFSQPLTKLTVKAESVIRASDNEVIITNTPFKFDGGKNYQLLLWKDKPKSGFYDVTIGVTSVGVKLVGVSNIEYRVKVTTTAAIEDVELGTREKDSIDSVMNTVAFGKKAKDFSADSQQKIVMTFHVKDLTDERYILPHQAFVLFVSRSNGKEIIFVAEPDKSGLYKFEVNLHTAAREQFNSASGKYAMYLIVGDAAISNPIYWHFAEVTLKIGEVAAKEPTATELLYEVKPAINHIFREPEPRPPAIVSKTFTAIVLLPFVMLLVLWMKIGVNLNNLNINTKTIIFLAGVAGIFILYIVGWIYLTMFEVVQYLVGVGAITFVFGNLVLSDLANNRS